MSVHAILYAWLRTRALSLTHRRTLARSHARMLTRTRTRTCTRVCSLTHVGLMRLVEWLPKEGITCLDLNSSDVISPETIKKLMSRSKLYTLNPET